MRSFALLGFDLNELKKIATELSIDYDMFVLDVQELVSYRLFDSKAMYDICGANYFEAQERKVIKSITEYERSIYLINFSILDKVLQFCPTIDIVYVKISKQELKNISGIGIEAKNYLMDYALYYYDYDELNQLAEKNSKYIVDGIDKKCVIDKIKNLGLWGE